MEEKIKKILESTFAYNVENDRVAEEIDNLYKQQRDELLLRANQLLSSLEYDNFTKFQKKVVVLLEQAIKNCK